MRVAWTDIRKRSVMDNFEIHLGQEGSKMILGV